MIRHHHRQLAIPLQGTGQAVGGQRKVGFAAPRQLALGGAHADPPHTPGKGGDKGQIGQHDGDAMAHAGALGTTACKCQRALAMLRPC